MVNIDFWSEDGRYGLQIAGNHGRSLLRLCRRACPLETGGILLGHYSVSHECAIVTEITKAPLDSQSGRDWFIRGVRGLQRKIDRLWHRNQGYYLGEWHFHPFGSPLPSSTDAIQMFEIAESEQYHCPEPVLLIVGGDPVDVWSVKAFVFLRKQGFIEMRSATP
ncbi:MAG: Mov34/MPN/PAD-1 family protein [Acidobacteria bacterium]|nr:Mov34/MPN/PAD-1 family protein [Acidobacteriota bacterium]